MPVLQLRQGTTAQVDGVTPDIGEPVWETDGLKLVVGDGSTAGGLHVMMESLFDANSMLYATADNTPLALTIAASRIVGRKASGAIAAMTGAETIALLTGANLDVGAYDVRGQTVTADGLTSGRVIFAGTNGVLSDDADFTFATDTLTVTKIGAFEATGAINFASQNMTNVDIDSGTIGAVTYDGTHTLNGQAFDAGSGYLKLVTTGAITQVLEATNTGVLGILISGQHKSSSPAVNDIVFRILGYGNDADTPANVVAYGYMDIMIEDNTTDHADGKFAMYLLRDQVSTLAMTLSGAGALWVDATVDCDDGYKVGGVAGVDFGPADATSFTVVKGIITAIS